MAHLIPVFPLLAFIINIWFGHLLKGASAWISVLASAASAVVSWQVFQSYQAGQSSYALGEWLNLQGVPIIFGVTVDGLSVMMLLVVTIIATLIKVYSIGYMQGDQHFHRFFAYLSLFTASMLGLILANNLLMMYMFWEGVGLCSYLLISFWYQKPSAASAGFKAFITTRVGDVGFLLGIFFTFLATNTISFADLPHAVGNETLLTIAAILIFVGAVGKSAQFPLHVWLPDAMEGPTPVSALIHAATMVAAGVYLVARTFGLFAAHLAAQEIVAIVGAISALMAATMAMVNNDIKRILAYSTMSQLGLMMLSLGAGGFTGGTFHLMTHAFFKALLFLCAGSLIHAVHTQDIQKMGGMFKHMKITATTLIIGTLAIAGVPPLAGFWSKEEILIQLQAANPIYFAVGVLVSLLTAFYMGRLMFLVLFGAPRSEEVAHAHESPFVMTIPLIILAVFAIGVGFLGSPLSEHAFQKFIIAQGSHIPEHDGHGGAGVMFISILMSLLGLGTAYLLYVRQIKLFPQSLVDACAPLHRLFVNKYYIDEIYVAIFVKPLQKLANCSFKFDVNVIDALVNGLAGFTQGLGSVLRLLQTGRVQNYLLIVAFGAAILFFSIVAP